jgi:hypothetical protein
MANQKYLLIYRNPQQNARTQPPSPAEMQQMYAAWNGWKDKFKDAILDVGDGLKPGGKLVTTSTVTDGPFVEAKEIVGGFSIVSADSYDRAVAIAKESPVMQMPGMRIEIREMMGF